MAKQKKYLLSVFDTIHKMWIGFCGQRTWYTSDPQKAQLFSKAQALEESRALEKIPGYDVRRFPVEG